MLLLDCRLDWWLSSANPASQVSLLSVVPSRFSSLLLLLLLVEMILHESLLSVSALGGWWWFLRESYLSFCSFGILAGPVFWEWVSCLPWQAPQVFVQRLIPCPWFVETFLNLCQRSGILPCLERSLYAPYILFCWLVCLLHQTPCYSKLYIKSHLCSYILSWLLCLTNDIPVSDWVPGWMF